MVTKMMRRRKSSCPDIDHRRTSFGQNRNGVKLDLYIEDDELYPSGASTGRHHSPSPTLSSSPDHYHRHRSSGGNIEDMAEEVLCLRLLSTRTRYRFGGLQIHIISPVFNVDKLFNVEFDQESQVSLIKSQQSNLDQASNGSIEQKVNGARMATIVISPEHEDEKDEAASRNLSSLSADLTLYEEPNKPAYQKKAVHVSAHSLTKICEPSECTSPPLQPSKRTTSSSSSINNGHSENVKFNNVKVYANLDRGSLTNLESINLETTHELPSKSKSQKNKITSQRRHTHYYCYIPSSVTQAAKTRHSVNSSDDLSTGSGARRMSTHNIRRFIGKKMSDTIHSAARVKKFFSDSFSILK